MSDYSVLMDCNVLMGCTLMGLHYHLPLAVSYVAQPNYVHNWKHSYSYIVIWEREYLAFYRQPAIDVDAKMLDSIDAIEMIGAMGVMVHCLVMEHWMEILSYAHDACKLMYHDPMPFPSFAILHGDFGTKPIEKRTNGKNGNWLELNQRKKSRVNLSLKTKERIRKEENNNNNKTVIHNWHESCP